MVTRSSTSLDPPDRVLVERVRGGDDRALGHLYDRHAPMVLALARAITESDVDAEEVAEAVFLHLWTHAARYDPERGTVRTYVATVARSRARDLVRMRMRRQEAVHRSAAASSGEFAVPVSNPGVDPEGEILRREVREQLDGLLGKLSREQREAIELAFFGGLTHGEIAARLDQPLGTVKTRIRDGMARLRSVVTEEGLGP